MLERRVMRAVDFDLLKAFEGDTLYFLRDIYPRLPIKNFSGNQNILHVAARSENPLIVQFILNKLPNEQIREFLRQYDDAGFMPIHYASSSTNGHLILPLFYHYMNEVNIPIREGYKYPIHLAAERGALDNLKALMLLGADINIIDASGKRPLYYAMRSKKYDIFLHLIKSGADLDGKDINGNTLMHLACDTHGYLDYARLLAWNGASWLHLNNDNLRPTKYCIDSYGLAGLFNLLGRLAIGGVYRLCKHYCSLAAAALVRVMNYFQLSVPKFITMPVEEDLLPKEEVVIIAREPRSSTFKKKADLENDIFENAIINNSLYFAKYFLNKGGNIKVTAFNGRNIFHLIAMNGSNILFDLAYEHIKMVCKAKKENPLEVMKEMLNQQDSLGNIPFYYAATSLVYSEVCNNLLAYMYPIYDFIDSDGRSPIHIATWARNQTYLQQILARPRDSLLADNKGWTPLHEAMVNGRFSSARTLINSGVAIDAKDNEGKTALHLVCENKRDGLGGYYRARLLSWRGASWLERDNNGERCTEQAIKTFGVSNFMLLMLASGCGEAYRTLQFLATSLLVKPAAAVVTIARGSCLSIVVGKQE